jgi:hypothetical protein
MGKSQIDEIGKRIAKRLGLPGPWYQQLDQGTAQEIDEIARAVDCAVCERPLIESERPPIAD